MINKPVLFLWITSKIESLEFKLKVGMFDSVEEVYRCEGELRILKQLYEDFNLESVNKNDLEYHNDFWSPGHQDVVWQNRYYMKKIFEELDWIWDYYFAYFLYSDMKRHRYHAYMSDKWGDRYKSKP